MQKVPVHISEQSPDIAGGVHVGKDDMDVGAGDQGIMVGYASDETSDYMPLTHSMATCLGKTLTKVRKNGECWWLRPDGKIQATIEYLQQPCGSVEAKKIHTVAVSTQHAEPLKAKRTKECTDMRHEMTAGELSVDDATNVLKTEFDCRPGAIAQSLALREPKYQETAENCHFGRQPETRNGIKFFEWQNAKGLRSTPP